MERSIRMLPKPHIIPSTTNPSLISSAVSPPPQFHGAPNHHQNDHTIILVSSGSNTSEDHEPTLTTLTNSSTLTTLTTLTNSSTRRRSRRFEYGYDTEEEEEEESEEENSEEQHDYDDDDGYGGNDDESHHGGFNASPLSGRDPRNYTMSTTSGLIHPRLWACIEVVFTLGQVILAMVMLMSSSPSSPEAELAPLWIWLAGYSMGCIASILLALWKLISHHRYRHRISNSNHYNQYHHQSIHHHHHHNHHHQQQQQQVQSNYIHHENLHHGFVVAPLRRPASTNGFIKVWMGKMRMCLDFFFAVWFVLGNVWVFGRPSLAQQTPRLYRLCVAFLALSCMSYALPFVLCIALCCCLPCFLNMRGGRILNGYFEARIYNNGVDPSSSSSSSSSCGGVASAALLATIPTAQFRPQSSLQINDKNAYDVNDECDDANDECDDGDTTSVRGGGGFIKCSNLQHNELLVEAEDAVCCICLRRYKENIELRILPCSHHFHLLCVDQWLQIKASCPLCNSTLYPNMERTLLK